MRSRVIVKYCKNLREEKGDLPREKKKFNFFRLRTVRIRIQILSPSGSGLGKKSPIQTKGPGSETLHLLRPAEGDWFIDLLGWPGGLDERCGCCELWASLLLLVCDHIITVQSWLVISKCLRIYWISSPISSRSKLLLKISNLILKTTLNRSYTVWSNSICIFSLLRSIFSRRGSR